jgi:hypothetical protein
MGRERFEAKPTAAASRNIHSNIVLFGKDNRFVTEGMEGAVETIGAGFENFLKVAPKSS